MNTHQNLHYISRTPGKIETATTNAVEILEIINAEIIDKTSNNESSNQQTIEHVTGTKDLDNLTLHFCKFLLGISGICLSKYRICIGIMKM